MKKSTYIIYCILVYIRQLPQIFAHSVYIHWVWSASHALLAQIRLDKDVRHVADCPGLLWEVYTVCDFSTSLMPIRIMYLIENTTNIRER